MKCTDCRPLLEEFFDGEADEKTSALVTVHLASCGPCAAAFEALRAEQELYLGYDRELEVTPALWHGVRARIAAAPPRPNLWQRLGGQLAAAVAVFQLRPALASSLALLAIGVTAGALWLTRPMPPAQSTVAIAENPTAAPATTQETRIPTPVGLSKPVQTSNQNGDDPSRLVVANNPGRVEIDRGRDVNVQPAAGTPAGSRRDRKGTGEPVNINVHALRDDLPIVPPLPGDDLADAMALLNPEDEAVARHVERAQLLLRAFKNTRAIEGEGTTNFAYERDLSRKLLDENISLQLEADATNNKTAKRVLSSLEPYLLDISNLRERPSRGDVRSIRERMEKQEIIAALHVYDD